MNVTAAQLRQAKRNLAESATRHRDELAASLAAIAGVLAAELPPEGVAEVRLEIRSRRGVVNPRAAVVRVARPGYPFAAALEIDLTSRGGRAIGVHQVGRLLELNAASRRVLAARLEKLATTWNAKGVA